jgi:sugar/nucleoside kinase (ribokinase family)
MNSVLVVGSLAYDSIETPSGRRDGLLGGSANYFGLAAARFAPIRVVGVVGDDYRESDRALLSSRGVDLTGLQSRPGRTFAWKGRYEGDLNEAITLATHLNVFENFEPHVPASYRDSKLVFLANIDPVLQLRVLDQMDRPEVVGLDTMNYWIRSKKSALLDVLRRVHVVLINEAEARDLTGLSNGVAAAEKIAAWGPQCVVIKRGEYGFLMFRQGSFFVLPAFPVAQVTDPTGAGDTFAGGFFGALAQDYRGTLDDGLLRRACINGCLLASFTVQDFGTQALLDLTNDQIAERREKYLRVINYR